MGRFRYAGEIESLRGKWFELPDDVKAPQARRYIESIHEAQQAEAEVETHEPAENDWDNQGGEAEASVSELDLLRESVANLNQRLEQPDASRAADAIASTARAMQSSWDISRDLQKLEEQARAATAKNQHLADSAEVFFKETEEQRQRTSKLIKANQDIVNKSFLSYADQINKLRREKEELQYDVTELQTEVKNGRKDLAKLRKILADWESKTNG